MSQSLTEVSLAWVEESICRCNKSKVLWLDEATGAENMTTRLARCLKDKGHLITLDKDSKSWIDWAYPKLLKENLLDTVTFYKRDLMNAEVFIDKYDGIYSDMTLSTMGITAIEALSVWSRLFFPGRILIIRDYLPQAKPRNDNERISNQLWQLEKAIEVLSGRTHYEEFPPEFLANQLNENGFCVKELKVDHQRKQKTVASFDEWCNQMLDIDIEDKVLKTELLNYNNRL